MRDIFLVNLRKAPFLFTLYHDFVCRRRGACSCGSLQERDKAGKVTIRRLPQSVQIDGKSVSGLLPIEVGHVPQVKAAMQTAPPMLVRVTRDDWLLRGLSQDDWERLGPAERLAMWRKSGALHPEVGEAREKLEATRKPKKPSGRTARSATEPAGSSTPNP